MREYGREEIIYNTAIINPLGHNTRGSHDLLIYHVIFTPEDP